MMEAGQIINLIATCGILVWMYFQKRSDKTAERLDELAKRMESSEKDLVELKSGLSHSLRHDDLARIYDALNKLSEQVNQMSGEFRSQSEMQRLIVNRITERGMG
jgi:uncharacterized coiled-coil protein SlyX